MKKDSSLQSLESLKIISIYPVFFATIGWFKCWNSPNLQKECFIKVLTMCHSFNSWQGNVFFRHVLARQLRKVFEMSWHGGEFWKVCDNWFYLAQMDDSNAEIVQIYRKSVLSKFLQCTVYIHLIFDRKMFAVGTCWEDNWESCLKFHGMPVSFEKYLISLVLFGTSGWFKCWNSPNLQKKCFIKVFTMCC